MDQTREIVRLVDEVLGRTAIGTYPHGSAVLGGLRPASDLDLLVVSRRTMDDSERAALLAGLLERSGFPPSARPVELTVVVQSEVRPWRFPPIGDFLFGEWLREEFAASGPPRPEPMPDLALLIAQVLSGDRALAGPPPAHVLDAVPHEDLVRASVAGVPELVAEVADDTRNVLLTLARVWTTLATGAIRPKDDAADWALARLPAEHRPVLAHARDLYRTRAYADETWPDGLRERVGAHVDHVLSEIGRLAGPPR
ncbi:aminoglycoside adenylyltransferase family protein [Streptomyces marincola]|uniref:Nucleotidyltransferase n=1 Tax=Streptomyces marincola TaxID=2878388 RepID=A0A1W7D542_9ACTN|nr:aminoglycoside adenylyltransferase family protein [Streptomyces marincola]ARQ72124.1 nucleotidyltransferase [Streptomyces marincola]